MSGVIILFLFFAFLGVVLTILFFIKRQGDHPANVILGLYTLFFSFEMINNCLRWSGALESLTFVHLNLTHFPLWLIYGPLVFIYVRRVVNGTLFSVLDVLFLLPPLVIMMLLFPFYRLKVEEKLDVVINGRTFDYAIFPSYAIWIVIAFMFGYGFLTYFSFWKKEELGFRENRWLKCFVGSYFGFVIAFASYIFLVRFELMDPSYDYFIDILIVAFISILSFFGFVQPEVFAGRSIRQVIPFVKYRKTGLTSSLSKIMRDRLIEIMDKDEPYLNSNLRLDDIAEALDLSRNHASQVINEHFNLSFFDFVNRYRVEKAKELLLERQEEGHTITQIAYESGFNNRASFYKAFRKFIGLSPSAFVEKQKEHT
ncbi:MAG: AraC family transcriptional regulator [Saprospiraceae bacterium]|nr:AraC family transcriptional regulator [Saprospiraceae bacterium]